MHRFAALTLATAFSLVGLARSASAQVAEAWTGSDPSRSVPVVQVGSLPQYVFQEPLFNGPGVQTLSDLCGRPLLIVFYSTRCGACVGGAVPAALQLQETQGDGLQVLFVETFDSARESCSYALKRHWLTSSAMWTSERPFAIRGRQVPLAFLLSSTGEVVLSGNPLAMKRELEQAVEREVRAVDAMPSDVPEVLEGAWTQFHRGKIGRAIELAEGFSAADDPALAAQARKAVETFRERGSARIAWVERLVETGHYVRAEALIDSLRAGVHGDRGLETRLDEIARRLEAPELKREREAAHALVEIENVLLLEGPERSTIEALDRFMVRFEGTQAARRARQLRDLATVL